ncbi:MAG: chromate transporter [Dysgonamonadaceae bacterium]|nr:chromate transporter [Dysgonamonadaceae bacterium]MDD4729250.1 chromate transporter [Dysgonamonadaceae bacterium]
MKKYWEIFLVFFKIGAFTFGGGYAMLPLIQSAVVDKKKWLGDKEFIDMLAIAQSMPGPIALNTAIFVGNKRKGVKGSIFSSLGIILPSFITILLLVIVFTQFRDNTVVESVFKGIRPAVVALIFAPLLRMGKNADITWNTIWIPIAVALIVGLLHISPVVIIILAITLGILYHRIIKKIINR